jgi:hypothetical protein
VGARFSAAGQTGLWGPPSLLYNGYRVSFPGVKRSGRGVDYPPSCSARVKERVQLYFYSPSGPSWPVLGRALPLPVYKFALRHVTNFMQHLQTSTVTELGKKSPIFMPPKVCVVSGFRRDVDEICALLGYYAALSGGSVPRFRDNLSVPSSRIKKSKKKGYAALCGSSVPTFRDITTTQRCVISQKSAGLNPKYIAMFTTACD